MWLDSGVQAKWMVKDKAGEVIKPKLCNAC